MASAEGLRFVSIGQYLPGDTCLHRLDPRAKLVVAGLVILGVVFATGYLNNGVLLAFVLALLWLGHLPLGYILRPIQPAIPIILVLSLFQLFFYRDPTGLAPLLWEWGSIQVSTASVRVVVVSWLRLLELMILMGIVMGTSRIGALTYGLEWFLSPLDYLHLPGHELAMVGAIALRFMPILGEQAELILMAQAARGVATHSASRWQLMRNARRIAALLIPLFVDAFRRSEEMILAMQARCYRGGRGRTHLLRYRFTLVDGLAILGGVAVLCVVIWMQKAGLP